MVDLKELEITDTISVAGEELLIMNFTKSFFSDKSLIVLCDQYGKKVKKEITKAFLESTKIMRKGHFVDEKTSEELKKIASDECKYRKVGYKDF